MILLFQTNNLQHFPFRACLEGMKIALEEIEAGTMPGTFPANVLPGGWIAEGVGLTFSYNLTIGIPVYILIATALTQAMPVK